MDRRDFLTTSALSAIGATAALGTTEAAGAATAERTELSHTSAGTPIGKASSVPVGGSATFTVAGKPGIVLQPKAGQFVAFNSTCTHEGCPVGFVRSTKLLVCPCHHSEFNEVTGAVVRGPAQRALAKFTVTVVKGELYVK